MCPSTYFSSLLNCVPCVLETCSHANVSCVLTCQRALRAHVLTCQRALRAYVLTCHRALRANWQLPYVLTYRKYQQVFFFGVKLIFCSVLYWDEESLLIKLEARRVTRNASRHNESFKILISQIHLGFVISLINNRCGSCQTYKKQFFAKIVNGLIPIYYFLKILHTRCLTVM